MEWLVPLRDTLFPSRSSITLRPQHPARSDSDAADEGSTTAPSAALPAHSARRRRSSLSDVDALLQRQKRKTVVYLSVRRDNHGGSIGDMMNLKQYGSSRSLLSMTSSIAELVPLETIQRRKTNVPVVASAG